MTIFRDAVSALEGLEVIDTHMHYGADPAIAAHLTVPELRYDDPEGFIATLDKYKIKWGVLLPPDRMLNPPSDFRFERANEAVARVVQRYPDRVVGLMRINPLFGDKPVRAQIRHGVEELGLRGIKLYPRADMYNSGSLKVMAPVMESAAEFDIPVLFHSGHAPRDLPSLQAYTARHFPTVKVILAHIGLHDFLNEAIIAANDYDNIYVDMSQAWPFDIRTFIRNVSPERLTYGSDSPFQSPMIEQLKLLECGLTADELKLVFSENAKKIWGLPKGLQD